MLRFFCHLFIRNLLTIRNGPYVTKGCFNKTHCLLQICSHKHQQAHSMNTHTDTQTQSSQPPCTLRPIKHSDLPPLGFVRHQLPTTCRREETPAPEQKIYSSITIHPDMNILPLHFHTACRIIALTESGCIIRGSSMRSSEVSAQFLQPSRFCADTSEPRSAPTKTTLFPFVSCRHI